MAAAVRAERGHGAGAAVLRAGGRGAQDGERARHAPIVFVAYRQGIAAATLLLASLAARGCTLRPMAVGARAFALIFAASLAT